MRHGSRVDASQHNTAPTSVRAGPAEERSGRLGSGLGAGASAGFSWPAGEGTITD